jgi:hypothetical protein
MKTLLFNFSPNPPWKSLGNLNTFTCLARAYGCRDGKIENKNLFELKVEQARKRGCVSEVRDEGWGLEICFKLYL